MNWLDAAIVSALLYGMWRGLSRGFGLEGFQTGGAVAGVVAAYWWGEQAAAALVQRLFAPEWLAKPAAILGIAFGFALAGHVAGNAWSRSIASTRWAAWDRGAGAFLGFMQASIVCGAVLVLWIEWPGRPFPEAVEGSLIARSLLMALPGIYSRLAWFLSPLR